ncbi:hypothetical protein FUAX_38670 (plasmid) [Fulvitalea axinellae]|uniref:DUF4251 domain-containing protein n=1 Tax=Fulvitalea axinellae TaxID=1182444 RepID=A0AAU9CPX0_9BACT|nr:hypothetical protein FUAX_38670 [Fulvitalea axinellae]
MKRIFIICVLVLTGSWASAQSLDTLNTEGLSKREIKKLKWKKAQEKRKLEQEAQIKLAKSLLDSGSFIVECDMLYGRYGGTLPVNPGTNFFAIHGEDVTFQIGTEVGHLGYNGIGGITVDGKAKNYKAKTRKKSMYARTQVMSPIGTYSVSVTAVTSENVRVRISGNWGHSIEMEGRIKPLEEHNVYKATPII